MRRQSKRMEPGKQSFPETLWEWGVSLSVPSETQQPATGDLGSEQRRVKDQAEAQPVMLRLFRTCCVTGGQVRRAVICTMKRTDSRTSGAPSRLGLL